MSEDTNCSGTNTRRPSVSVACVGGWTGAIDRVAATCRTTALVRNVFCMQSATCKTLRAKRVCKRVRAKRCTIRAKRRRCLQNAACKTLHAKRCVQKATVRARGYVQNAKRYLQNAKRCPQNVAHYVQNDGAVCKMTVCPASHLAKTENFCLPPS